MMYLLRRLIYLSLLTWLFLSQAAQAVSLDNIPVITLDQGQISFFRDAGGHMTLDDIRLTRAKNEFKPLKSNLGAGYVKDTFWLHLSLNHLPAQSLLRWLEVIPPYLDNINLYHISPGGQIDHRRGGDFLPQSAKEEAYRGHLFKLNFTQGQHELYLRLKTTSTMVATIKLWQPEAFSSHLRNSYFAFGIYFSLILSVLIFNLANWVVSHRIIFITYVVYLTLNSLQWLGINGFVAEFIFPEQPLLANLTLGMSLSLAAAMAFVFFSMLFELRKYHPYIYRLNQFGAFLGVATAIATPLGYYQSFAPWLLLTAIVSLGSAPWPLRRLWHSRETWARLLVLAYSVFAVLVSLNIFSSLAILPFSEPYIYVGMASNIFHILILHFAILLHFRGFEKAHKEAIEQTEVAKHQTNLERSYREEQSQLLAMITHEIRTPIAVINAANESLQMLDSSISNKDENRTRRYDRINNAVMRMNLVMEMALAHKENDNLPFEKILIDLVWLTHEVIELSGVDAVERVVLKMPEDDVTVYADARLLRIALLNLLGNALKYSPAGSPINISIQVIAYPEHAGVEWVIDDKGQGVPEGMQDRIFEKYQRGDERHNQPGMGLGLFLVSRIVKRHGGRVNMENLPEAGARFCLWLPCVSG